MSDEEVEPNLGVCDEVDDDMIENDIDDDVDTTNPFNIDPEPKDIDVEFNEEEY